MWLNGPLAPQHTDSHACTRLAWYRSLPWWSHSQTRQETSMTRDFLLTPQAHTSALGILFSHLPKTKGLTGLTKHLDEPLSTPNAFLLLRYQDAIRQPGHSALVKGWESVCWGWSGAGVGVGMLRGAGDSLTCLRGAWFLVLLFLGFKVCWFLGFLVSKFLSFLVSKFRLFNDPILPHFHFMFSGRYWSHIQYFQKTSRQILMNVRRTFFSKLSNCSKSTNEISNNN